MRRFLRNYGLSVTLTLLFLSSWALHALYEYRRYADEQRSQNQPVEMTGYMDHFWAATFENWQSEFLQLLTFVILTAMLYHKGSHESKDTDEEMQAQLNRIEQMLQQQERKAA
jgi:hypothetical protein